MKENIKNSKILIIVISVITVLVVGLILTLALMDTVVANVKRSRLRDAASNAETVVITAPLYKDSFSYGAEIVLTDDEAKNLREDFIAATEDASFDTMISGAAGYWDTQIRFYMGDEYASVYLKQDSFYLAGNNGYLFRADNDAYAQFYQRVGEMLDEKR